jgi:hypothetical protein
MRLLLLFELHFSCTVDIKENQFISISYLQYVKDRIQNRKSLESSPDSFLKRMFLTAISSRCTFISDSSSSTKEIFSSFFPSRPRIQSAQAHNRPGFRSTHIKTIINAFTSISIAIVIHHMLIILIDIKVMKSITSSPTTHTKYQPCRSITITKHIQESEKEEGDIPNFSIIRLSLSIRLNIPIKSRPSGKSATLFETFPGVDASDETAVSGRGTEVTVAVVGAVLEKSRESAVYQW